MHLIYLYQKFNFCLGDKMINESVCVDSILSRYTLVNENEILEFISKIGDKMVSLLDSIYYLVRRYFPHEDLKLEYVPDYEEPVLSLLVIYVSALGDEAIDKVYDLYDEWDFSNQDDEICGKLIVNLE